MPAAACLSPVVELCPHGMKPFARDAIGTAIARCDQAAFAQPAKGRQRAIGEPPALPGHAGHRLDLSLAVFFDANETAARERMKRPLLELRDIHE